MQVWELIAELLKLPAGYEVRADTPDDEDEDFRDIRCFDVDGDSQTIYLHADEVKK